ncbi:MAG: ribonuclease III [Oscillospiraceae bacterium]|nr:ribonuclease III [Oscillospiraceae bacterium]
MHKSKEKSFDYKNVNSSALAFLGDCVFDMIIRLKLVCSSDFQSDNLHKLATKEVCCQAQANFFEKISKNLTKEEMNVYKRGRNFHVTNIPKNATSCQYHSATGLECLFGYLLLKQDKERLINLFSIAYKISEEILNIF